MHLVHCRYGEAAGVVAGALLEAYPADEAAGDIDHMLRVMASDVAAYDRFYKRLIAAVPIKNFSSRFSMERVKSTTALPFLPG